ncbi:HAD-IC family P-type ATPase [Thomasclavelia saccharogumia]|uniref:HAD-IC family P-type ATPase n=1 Tax=Thomasclavelia saccharogumia TaxID=341225 RepID=UPI00047CE29E|nr:HAD-IC family P-type ATPase [Thomasclavelia saccharogumia]
MKINNQNYPGLTSLQVKQRIDEGKINHINNKITKSYKEIFLNNTITFFNILNAALLGLVLFVESYKNTLFILVIITNTIAGIYQEVKAKRTLDRLSIITTAKVEVIRDDHLKEISIDEIVLDDYLVLTTGMQIPTDSILVDGQMETNEALLTGESDPVLKQNGDQLYSGSFITSGKGICKVIHVGDDNYMNKITNEAKRLKKHNSQLNQCLNTILKYVSIFILPIGGLLFLKQLIYSEQGFNDAIVSTVAAVLGMIPEGLVLLTSAALTLSVLRLAKQKTLVQELFCIETLARVDVLCLDKTGTITEGTMKVEFDIKTCNLDFQEIMGNLMHTLTDVNVTAQALKEHYPCKTNFKPCHVIPFSSDRKYSGTSFYDHGTYYLGAYQFLFPQGDEDLEELCFDYTSKGYRILVLAHTNKIINNENLPSDLKPCGVIVLSDVIRDDAKETLRYFESQGVDLKIISGDDPITVSAIAKRAGLKSRHYIDATKLTTAKDIQKAVKNYSVFGRVTPQQKKEMVLALKQLGHTVAMTGDGVNDVLAFKEADCSIAMASGSDAAKNTANLVLLNNNFNAMPYIVDEGRRVINNITMSASMFLIKTIFSVLISISTIFFGQAYPFEPIQLSLISACCVGIPTFFLTYEANFAHVKGNFFKNVLEKSFPSAFTIALGTTLITNIGLYLGYDPNMLSTVCILFTGCNYTIALLRIYSPLTRYRKIIIYTTQMAYYISMIIGQSILDLTGLDFNWLMVLLALIAFSPLLVDFSGYLFRLLEQLFNKYKKNKIKL